MSASYAKTITDLMKLKKKRRYALILTFNDMLAGCLFAVVI